MKASVVAIGERVMVQTRALPYNFMEGSINGTRIHRYYCRETEGGRHGRTDKD